MRTEDTNKTGSKKSKLDAKTPCDYYKSNELDTFNLRILVSELKNQFKILVALYMS